MKQVKIKTLLLLLLIAYGELCNAQVVIGSTTQNPNAGAILDLSKKDNGINTNLGLLLPNIQLTSTTMRLVPEAANVEGMLVYCPGGTGMLAKGLYVWDGTEWAGVILNS
jgi:hypothetical protein